MIGRLDSFRQQRQLPWACFLRGEIGEGCWIVAGETVVGELRPRWITAFEAHSAIDAIDRQKRERIRADKFAYALEVVSGGEQFVALGGVDAIIVRVRDRWRSDAEVHFLGASVAH